MIAEHPRCFAVVRPSMTLGITWPVLARKPGALRNGAPFRDWGVARGDGEDTAADSRVPTTATGRWCRSSPRSAGLRWACRSRLRLREALAHGVASADVVLNILARARDPAPALTIMTPDALKLAHAPVADWPPCHWALNSP